MTGGWTRGAAWVLLALATSACSRATPPAPGSEGRAPQPASADVDGLLRDVRRAAERRNPALVPERALAHHDPRVRREATAALARLADPAAIPALERKLHDEDDRVVAWAAHGLGLLAAGRESETVPLLAARLASLKTRTESSEARFAVAADFAIADALGRAATPAAERTLTALLDGPKERGTGAARALARLAAKTRRLDDRTIVALLDAAARPDPIDDALSPIAFTEGLAASAAARLVEVAMAVLARGGKGRSFAARALAVGGPSAVAPLAALVNDDKASIADRSLAARSLGKLGDEGQKALGDAAGSLFSHAGELTEPFLAERFPVLHAVLGALAPPLRSGQDALVALASATLPAKGTPASERRLASLRCAAAGALAGTASHSARLGTCDVTPGGRFGALATLDVLDRGELTRARFDTWKTYADAKDPAVRRAAMSLVGRHPEMPAVTPLLEQALAAKEPGIVVEAARALAAVPRQATGEEPAPVDTAPGKLPSAAPALVEALAKALDAPRPADQIELRVALARAVGVLGVLSLKPRVEALCRDERYSVRRGAELALRALGSGAAECAPPRSDKPASDGPPPSTEPLSLTFVTDVGRLGVTLDPVLAPLAVERIAELARTGFYDGTAIGRVAPGFVVQLGDPVGDGFSGSGKDPVPSETSPARAGALSVGLAVSGRDTGSSQIFVALSDDPALDAEYPLLGYADPEWATVAEGDVIQSVEVRKAASAEH